jgi:hypothetical protein
MQLIAALIFIITATPSRISGTTDAPPGTAATLTIGSRSATTTVQPGGRWEFGIDWPLPAGTHIARIEIAGNEARVEIRVLSRQPFTSPAEPQYATETPPGNPATEMTDRWRITPPPYELDERPRGRFDPYNQNWLKGDYPVVGNDLFLVLTGISDTLAETRTLPTPSGVSTQRPGSFPFFGRSDQSFFNQNFTISADLYRGDTTFQPVRERVKATVIANFNTVRVEENAILKPDVRRGTERSNGYLSLQEFFYERKLRDLSPNYDFVSIRIGSQPFASDFRGFVFSDTNLGARLFGNWASNRYQYNLAVFDRLEKDTNSGLNTLRGLRAQQVAVANLYWQDFLRSGYTQQFSIHAMHDAASLHYDRNGFLVRPAPIGVFQRHEIFAYYIGEAGLGHMGRVNVDQAAYYVFGHDTLNPLAGPDPRLRVSPGVRIGAAMAAIELSYDRDWLRPRIALFYASGDSNPRDRHAHGFDAIDDSTAFAGGGFSFFNRLGIRLPATGVSLVERGSLLPDLKTSKDEGQPNYVNPGLLLASAGVDADVTPRLKTIFTVNYIRLDSPAPIEALLFQSGIHRDLGIDISAGMRYRPFLNNNVVIVAGVAAFLPRRGFTEIYDRRNALYHMFTGLVLTF